MRCIVMAVALVLSVIGCGGEEGGDTLSVTGERSSSYDETASSAAPWGNDPEIFAQAETTIDGIEVGMYNAFTGDGPADGWTEWLFVNYKRSEQPGSFDVTDNSLSLLYRDGPDLYVAVRGITGSGGSALLDAVGAVGEPIEGSFDATLCKSANGSDFPLDCAAGSLAMSGSFRATREPTGTEGRGKD